MKIISIKVFFREDIPILQFYFSTDIVQDIASKGLSLVHINSKQEERENLVSNILDQFTQGRRTVQQVTADTKLFEEGQMGKSPSG